MRLAALVASSGLIAAGGPAPVFWGVSVYTDDDGAQVATVVDTASIPTPAAGTRDAKVYLVHAGDRMMDESDYRFDCAKSRLKTLANTLVDLDDGSTRDVPDSLDRDAQGWTLFPADSDADRARRFVCGWPSSAKDGFKLSGGDRVTMGKALAATLAVKAR